MFKKIIAAVLCATMLAGVAGCDLFAKDKDRDKARSNARKQENNAESEIEDLVDSLEKGFNDFDPDEILECTNWDESNEYYAYVYDRLNRNQITEIYGSYLVNIYEIIAKTIDFDYDIDDLEIDGDKATWEMQFEIMDWQPVFLEWRTTYDEAVSAVREQQDTVKYDLRIKFERVDGEWKVSSIYRIEDILSFTWAYPVTEEANEYFSTYANDYVEEDPGPPPYADLSPADFYHEAMVCYLSDLDANSEGILALEEECGIKTCVLYDIENDGIPELFYIRIDPLYHTLDFDRMSFTEYGGSAYGHGSSVTLGAPMNAEILLIWFTGDYFVITYGYDNNGAYTIKSEIAQFDLDDPNELSREAPDSGNANLINYYNYDSPIIPDEYMRMLRKHVNEAEAIFIKNWDITPDDPEYNVTNTPELNAMTYRQMHEYLENQIG